MRSYIWQLQIFQIVFYSITENTMATHLVKDNQYNIFLDTNINLVFSRNQFFTFSINSHKKRNSCSGNIKSYWQSVPILASLYVLSGVFCQYFENSLVSQPASLSKETNFLIFFANIFYSVMHSWHQAMISRNNTRTSHEFLNM